MKYQNSLVSTPLKVYHINDLIRRVNAELIRPCMYSAYIEHTYGISFKNVPYDNHLLYIPLPILKRPKISIQITGVGAMPSDSLIGGAYVAPLLFAPWIRCTQNGYTPGTQENTAYSYANQDLNKAVPIVQGSIVELTPTFSDGLIGVPSSISGYVHSLGMELRYSMVAPSANTAPFVDGGKVDPEQVTTYYHPSFTVSATVSF